MGACGTVGITTVGGILNHYLLTDNSSGTTIADALAEPVRRRYITAVSDLCRSKRPGGHTIIASPSGFTTTAVPPLTINFTGAQLNDLTTYIGYALGGDFALLLDSDCHYFFSNAVFSMTTSSPVPEPGSVLLLLTVVAFVCVGLRKKRAAAAA